MKKIFFSWCLMLGVLSLPFSSVAEEEKASPPKYSYFTLEPDIIANFVTEGDRLGFVTAKVELMVDTPELLKVVEHHQPLIRDTIIEYLTREKASRIESVTGREIIRKDCLAKINEMLKAETDQDKVVADLLFTKYVYE